MNFLQTTCSTTLSIVVSYALNNSFLVSPTYSNQRHKLCNLIDAFTEEFSLRKSIEEMRNDLMSTTREFALIESAELQILSEIISDYFDEKNLTLDHNIRKWRNGVLEIEGAIYNKVWREISQKSKLPPIYCALSMATALPLGSFIATRIVNKKNKSTKKKCATISSMVLTALFTLFSTKSATLTAMNTSICALNFFFRLG